MCIYTSHRFPVDDGYRGGPEISCLTVAHYILAVECTNGLFSSTIIYYVYILLLLSKWSTRNRPQRLKFIEFCTYLQ